MDKYTLNRGTRKNFLRLIWRIEVDPAHNLMAVESRDAQQGVFCLSVIDYSSGFCFLDEREIHLPDVRWTLAGIRDGVVVLRKLSASLPFDAGICGFSATTGDLLWQRYDLVLGAVVDDCLIVRQRSWTTGGDDCIAIQDGQPTKKKPFPNKPSDSNIVIPMVYFGEVPEILSAYEWVGDLWQTKFKDIDVWAFHEYSLAAYQIRLVITNSFGLIGDEVVMSDVGKMLPEIFFMIGSRVFIVADNKRDLISYLV